MSSTYRGALWMVAYAVAYSLMVGIARHLASDFSAFELVFFRALVAVAVLAPWALLFHHKQLRTQRLGIHAQRAVLGFGAQTLWFYAISAIPLGDAVAVQFILPLLTVLAANIFLGEALTRTRMIATTFGLLGMLVIVRPGFAHIDVALGAALGSAVLYAGATVTAKSLSHTEETLAVVFYVNLLMLPLAIGPAAYTWDGFGLGDMPWLILLGVLGLAANVFLAKSFVAADASAVIPIDFLRLPLSAGIEYAFFGQATDPWTWVGAAIIVSSSYLLTRAEHGR